MTVNASASGNQPPGPDSDTKTTAGAPLPLSLPPWVAPLIGVVIGAVVTYFGVQEIVKIQLRATERVGTLLGRVEADEQRLAQLRVRVDAASTATDNLNVKLKQIEQTDAAKIGDILRTVNASPDAADLVQRLSAVQRPILEFHDSVTADRSKEQDLGVAAFCGISIARTVHHTQACGCVVEKNRQPDGQNKFTGKLTADRNASGKCVCQFFCVKYASPPD